MGEENLQPIMVLVRMVLVVQELIKVENHILVLVQEQS